MKFFTTFVAAGLLLPLAGNAKVELPSMISSGMVLQQQSDAKLWGKAKPDSEVNVTPSWTDGKTVTTKADKQGKWMTSVATPVAGGPYTITISDGEPVTLYDVLIGEVWFASGQSNMEHPIGGFDRQPVFGGNDVIARAKPSTPIRIFSADWDGNRKVNRHAKTPQSDVNGEWWYNTPDNVARTSAVAYNTAKYIQEVLDVPVGIIVSTVGGSDVECWTSREVLEKFPEVDLSILDNDKPVKNLGWTPAVLFNGKIAPFIPYTIRGFLWYQGENNIRNREYYAQHFPAMVADWRARWGNDNLPFYFVEIAPFRYGGYDHTDCAEMRSIQQKCTSLIPHSGIVSMLDCGNFTAIHPENKTTPGERMAWLALADTYGRTGFGSRCPMYDSMEIKDGKIYINVKYAERGLSPMWTSLKGFEIAGKDRVFHPAFAEIEESTCRLAVSSPEVPEPVAVRYAFKNCPEYSVYNIHGLPLMSFRTDDWPLK